MEHLKDDEFKQLVIEMVHGWASLFEEVQLLSYKNQMLERDLAFREERYQDLADKYAPFDDTDTFLKTQEMGRDDYSDMRHRDLEEPCQWMNISLRGKGGEKDGLARNVISQGSAARNRITEILGQGIPLPTSSSEMNQGSLPNTRPASVATGSTTHRPRPIMQQDFTTLGRKSKLQCPFANDRTTGPDDQSAKFQSQSLSLQEAALPTPPGTREETEVDPMTARVHRDLEHERRHSSPPPSATGSASKCPIRFLDQYSPEEVAEYFENHKHEIPRSHEICVKRYQSNSESIRQLDAKYGNLVNMIQGLGHKHQPLLPMKEEADAARSARQPNDRVEDWANGVSGSDTGYIEGEATAEGDRKGHFDRPMKDIRVGESPSRPWGISVPNQTVQSEENTYESDVLGDEGIKTMDAAYGEALEPSFNNKSSGCPFSQKKTEQPTNGENVRDDDLQRSHEPVGSHDLKKFASLDDRIQRLETLMLKMDASLNTGTVHKSVPQETKARSPPTVRCRGNAAFVEDCPTASKTRDTSTQQPQMVFTGPVFIGYPMEQAIDFMQQNGLISSSTR
ncbi:MAG: hypothetical protein M1827_003770 [Pycnora praestabilis]|nr:MAG: hypothetical protein M1827_003770 [Pycnora praestabilis]